MWKRPSLGRALDTRTTAIHDRLFRKDFFWHLSGFLRSAKYFCVGYESATVQNICFLHDTCPHIVSYIGMAGHCFPGNCPGCACLKASQIVAVRAVRVLSTTLQCSSELEVEIRDSALSELHKHVELT